MLSMSEEGCYYQLMVHCQITNTLFTAIIVIAITTRMAYSLITITVIPKARFKMRIPLRTISTGGALTFHFIYWVKSGQIAKKSSMVDQDVALKLCPVQKMQLNRN